MKINSELPIGQQCSPGCVNHLSHPCEKCGRYAAGTRTTPDFDAQWDRVFDLIKTSQIAYAVIVKGHQGEWSKEQILAEMVLIYDKVLNDTQKAFEDYMSNSVTPMYKMYRV